MPPGPGEYGCLSATLIHLRRNCSSPVARRPGFIRAASRRRRLRQPRESVFLTGAPWALDYRAGCPGRPVLHETSGNKIAVSKWQMAISQGSGPGVAATDRRWPGQAFRLARARRNEARPATPASENSLIVLRRLLLRCL